jgi:hypothetical protein
VRTSILFISLTACVGAQTYHQILATGQSLATGCGGYAALSTAYQNNKSLTLGSTALEAAGVFQFDQTPLISLAPTIRTCNNSTDFSNPGQTTPDEYPVLAAVNQLTYMQGGASGNRYIASLHGASGRRYSTGATPFLAGPTDVAGGAPFTNGQLQITNSISAAGAANYSLDAVLITHGESDDAASDNNYELYLSHWQWDYERISNAAASRQGVLPMFVDQVNSWGFYRGSGTVPIVALAQWRAAEDYPGKIFLTTPKYFLPTSGAAGDGVHLSNAGYQWLGELDGKAMNRVLYQGRRWTAVMPKSITSSGTTITAVFWVPVGNLQFDTTTVSAQTNKGFELSDGGGATITGVSITASDTVQITISQALAVGAQLRYAYTAPAATGGGLGNLKDTDPTTSLTGRNLSDWCVTFAATIPFASKLQSTQQKHSASVGISFSAGVAH